MPQLYYWVANWNLSRAEAANLLHESDGSGVVDMLDTTGSALETCLRSNIGYVATYVTGSDGIAATTAQWIQLGGLVASGRLNWALPIDQSDGTGLVLTGDRLLVKDTEPGAGQPDQAAANARARLDAGLDYIIYVDTAELSAVEDAVQAHGLAPGELCGYQYASPTSNPGSLLPGTGLTLQQSNADLSVMKASLFEGTPPPKPGSGTFKAVLAEDGHGGWTVKGIPGEEAVLGGPDVWQEVKVGLNRKRGLWRASGLPLESH